MILRPILAGKPVGYLIAVACVRFAVMRAEALRDMSVLVGLGGFWTGCGTRVRFQKQRPARPDGHQQHQRLTNHTDSRGTEQSEPRYEDEIQRQADESSADREL